MFDIREKRVKNLIFTGAENYDFMPSFSALDFDGNVDFYMNLVIGLAYKYFGEDGLNSLFDPFKNSALESSMDIIAWTLIERLVFKKEYGKRPVLSDLRLAYAENFFKDEYDLKRRAFAIRQNKAYSIHELSLKDILEKLPSRMREKDRKLLSLLNMDEGAGIEDVRGRLEKIFKDYLRVDIGKFRGSSNRGQRNNLFAFSQVSLEYSVKPTNFLKAVNNQESKPLSPFQRLSLYMRTKDERQIIELFGDSAISDRKIYSIEKNISIEADRKSKIWFTRGLNSLGRKKSLSKGEDLQKTAIERNLAYYNKNKVSYNRQIASLSQMLKAVAKNAYSGEVVRSKTGRLLPELAYKSAFQAKPSIFERTFPSTTINVNVDIFLDASASRMKDCQDIASQAFILAKALDNCGISSRVTSFVTFGAYTVLTELKAYEEEASFENIFRYRAMGFNRDGFAYKALGEIYEGKMGQSLLIILTDASPNDLLPLYISKFRSRSYEGRPALEETRKSLNSLRKKGVKPFAILQGGLADSENARFLFADNFAKITSANELSSKAGRFIAGELKRLQG
ncbi:MAG: hypothetical protein GX219_07855 [Tissierellia bacterium]|nr:hypothetical protein [Tissierellia bacterium]